MISGFVAHLWQSTLFVGVVWLLTLALRKNQARIRYGIWFIASAKFLIPFSLLVGLGAFVPGRATAPPAQTGWVAVAEQVRPLVTIPAVAAEVALTVDGANRSYFASAVFFLWSCGFAAIAIFWARQWSRIGRLRRRATPLSIRAGVESAVPVMSAPGLVEPGVFGVFRPVLLLPEGIGERLDQAQLKAILAHEICHVRRRDNLTATMHMVVQATFWFHPLVWWLGARLVDERERACDEEVLRLGNRPQVYAEGILNVCKLYLESPLVCVPGVTGANLKRRIEAIMKNRIRRNLSSGGKLLLAIAGVVAVAGPLAIGIIDTRVLQGQSAPAPAPKYEVATIRPAKQDEERGFDTEKGRFMAHNVTMKALVARAYNVDIGLISGGPKWVDSDRYDINAKFADELAQPTSDQGRMMLQNLLTDRFQLVIHREPAEVPGYALVIAKNGPKMDRADPDLKGIKIRSRDNHLIAQNVTMEAFAKDLNRIVGKMVVDRTGLSGYFKFELDWMPERPVANMEPSSEDRPSIFTALQERLGLRLESAKIPTTAVVIDRVEKPSAN
jgi:bla regulator protein blaR1